MLRSGEPAPPAVRRRTLDSYVRPLEHALGAESTAEAMGAEEVYRLQSLVDRVVLAELRPNGAVELPEDAPDGAIPVFPILPKEDPTAWYMGSSISDRLQPATVDLIETRSLQPSSSPEALAAVQRQAARGPHRLSRVNIHGRVDSGVRAFTDGTTDVDVCSVPLVTLCPRVKYGVPLFRLAILGHELTHAGQVETTLTSLNPSAATIIQTCNQEVEAYIAEAGVVEGGIAAMGWVRSCVEARTNRKIVDSARGRVAALSEWQQEDPLVFANTMLHAGAAELSPAYAERLSEADKEYLGWSGLTPAQMVRGNPDVIGS
jgi:hypothetical protein